MIVFAILLVDSLKKSLEKLNLTVASVPKSEMSIITSSPLRDSAITLV